MLREPVPGVGATRFCAAIRQVQAGRVGSGAGRDLHLRDVVGLVLPLRARPLRKELKARYGFQVLPRDHVVLEFFGVAGLLVPNHETRELQDGVAGVPLVPYYDHHLEKVRRNRHDRWRPAECQVPVLELPVSHLPPRQPQRPRHHVHVGSRGHVLGVYEAPDPFLQAVPDPLVHDGVLRGDVAERVGVLRRIPGKVGPGSHVAPVEARLVVVGELRAKAGGLYAFFLVEIGAAAAASRTALRQRRFAEFLHDVDRCSRSNVECYFEVGVGTDHPDREDGRGRRGSHRKGRVVVGARGGDAFAVAIDAELCRLCDGCVVARRRLARSTVEHPRRDSVRRHRTRCDGKRSSVGSGHHGFLW
mmetsp:Transcript_26571/g.56951  ORF Transcript_26571/g.56951 Transcript_26571/m.56951 type:complete len:360 (-) Transcript_26571:161-1240(-)